MCVNETLCHKMVQHVLVLCTRVYRHLLCWPPKHDMQDYVCKEVQLTEAGQLDFPTGGTTLNDKTCRGLCGESQQYTQIATRRGK